jgi:hypothetical protein
MLIRYGTIVFFFPTVGLPVGLPVLQLKDKKKLYYLIRHMTEKGCNSHIINACIRKVIHSGICFQCGGMID